ncbi:MAG: nuclear transport factor 2 family protein [Gammaproteobacteria bacterium]|nr:nuclear transport factor 2 family protein [Gammaproteobacteria bacterium]
MMKVALVVTLLLILLAAAVKPSYADAKPEEQILQSLQTYFQAWNEPVVDKRDALLKNCWADNAEYTDPGTHAKGRAALSMEIGNFLSNEQLKGFSIVQASNIDVHHRVFRFQWEMRDSDGNAVTPGMDYGEYDDQGRITKIVGFFGPFQTSQ